MKIEMSLDENEWTNNNCVQQKMGGWALVHERVALVRKL